MAFGRRQREGGRRERGVLELKAGERRGDCGFWISEGGFER
jgi:hypothetical protein